VYSTAETKVKQFSTMVVDGFLRHNLFDQIYALATKTQFTNADHHTLETIDEHITTVIVKADKQSQSFNQAPWSSGLHHAYLLHCYWVLRLSKH